MKKVLILGVNGFIGHHLSKRILETTDWDVYGMDMQNDRLVDFLPKVKIEAAVEDGILERAIEAIEKSARTGKIGDGKIFVSSIEHVIRIRTGETGAAAL